MKASWDIWNVSGKYQNSFSFLLLQNAAKCCKNSHDCCNWLICCREAIEITCISHQEISEVLWGNISIVYHLNYRPSERGNFSHLLLSFSLERQEVPFPIGFLPFYVSPPPFPRLIASASMTASCSLTVLLTFLPNLCYPDGKEIKEVGNTIVLGSVPNMHTWYPDLDKKNLH